MKWQGTLGWSYYDLFWSGTEDTNANFELIGSQAWPQPALGSYFISWQSRDRKLSFAAYFVLNPPR